MFLLLCKRAKTKCVINFRNNATILKDPAQKISTWETLLLFEGNFKHVPWIHPPTQDASGKQRFIGILHKKCVNLGGGGGEISIVFVTILWGHLTFGHVGVAHSGYHLHFTSNRFLAEETLTQNTFCSCESKDNPPKEIACQALTTLI